MESKPIVTFIASSETSMGSKQFLCDRNAMWFVNSDLFCIQSVQKGCADYIYNLALTMHYIYIFQLQFILTAALHIA